MATAAELAADIADMETLLASATRPKVRAMLSDYLAQLRAEQLTRSGGGSSGSGTADPSVAAATRLPASPSASAAPPAAAKPVKLPPQPMPTPAASSSTAVLYTTISSFGWDQDAYGKEPNFVYVYILSGVDGVGEIKNRVTCDFTASSFDLKILGLNGKNYRLKKDNLDKKINVAESKIVVKKNKITIKMKKVKGEFGYDSWLDLTAKRPKLTDDGKEKDPGASLMDMMKDMYDNGDDTMKKALGEAMLKSRQKEQGGVPDIDGA